MSPTLSEASVRLRRRVVTRSDAPAATLPFSFLLLFPNSPPPSNGVHIAAASHHPPGSCCSMADGDGAAALGKLTDHHSASGAEKGLPRRAKVSTSHFQCFWFQIGKM